MSRNLDPYLVAMFGSSVVNAVFLASFELPTETVRVWTGVGTVTWDGESWIGMGSFGKVSQIEETASDAERGAAFEISDIPSGIFGPADLSVDIQGRDCRLWLAGLTEAGAIVCNPDDPLYAGLMDQIQAKDDGKTCIITLSTENRSRGQIRSVRRTYSDADQRAEYPDDTWCKLTAAVPNTPFSWGDVDAQAA